MVTRCERSDRRVAERANSFHERGIGLIGVLIGLVVVVCLGVIINTDYRAHQQARTFADNRKVAQEMLLEVAKRQEAYFREHKTYTDDLSALGYAQVEDLSVASPRGLYKVVVTSADAVSFALAAEPQGDQLGDSSCGALTFDKKGTARGARGSDGTACW